MKPTAEISKFEGMRAPLMANTSGIFDRPMLASSRGGTISIPGFAPVNAFPYPGIVRGNASQIDGLLPGSGRVDMIAANMYRAQDRRDDVASGLGVTGLNSAPKGNVSGRKVNLTNPNTSIIPDTTTYDSFSDSSFVSPRKSTPRRNSMPSLESPLPGLGLLSPIKQEKVEQMAVKATLFDLYNNFKGNSKEDPLKVLGSGAPMRQPSTRQKIPTTIFSPSS